MLKRIVIENYRSCLRTSIDLQPDLSVLIGPNSSGKTNILQAIMLLNRMASEQEHRAAGRADVSVSSRIKATFEELHAQVQLRASIAVRPDESNTDVMLATRQKWLVERRRRRARFEFPLALAAQYRFPSVEQHYFRFGTVMPPPYYYVRFPSEMPKWIWPVLGKVANYCRGIRYYGASQFTNPGTCPASFEIEQEGRHRRLFRLRGHAKILYDMYSAKKAEVDHRYQQFIDIVGPKGLKLVDDLTFREVQTSSIDYSVRVGGKVEVRRKHKLLVVPQFRIGKQKLSPNQLSEGTFKTLSLLFHVITEEGTALLIEEPEVCVHHGLLSSILELIKSYSRRKQMILSTHSDYVLDHVRPENVYRVAFDKSLGTVARHIPKAMTSKELSALRQYLEREG